MDRYRTKIGHDLDNVGSLEGKQTALIQLTYFLNATLWDFKLSEKMSEDK